jgi:hypothetical protein
MSHVTVIAVELKDLDALKAVCAALGLELRENQKTYRWYGHHVGDYPIPEGFTKADLGKCDHAIAVKGNRDAYEVGLVKRGDAFIPLWDFWQGGYGLREKIGEGGSTLISAYTKEVAVRKARQFAKSKGWSYSERLDKATQETVITLRKY